ncbi:DUF6549 family protein [Limibacter armeniacum]|uniref:DUF6549 family protein n=1 Tax=Limibacter armeniacum TaxID=466084 RepID=UPI002FE579DC
MIFTQKKDMATFIIAIQKVWQFRSLILLGLLIALGSYARHLHNGRSQLGNQLEETVQLLDGAKQEVRKYETDNRQLIWKAQTLEVDKNTLEDIADTKQYEWLKKYEKLKRDYRNLQSALELQMEVKKVIDTVIHDTTIILMHDTAYEEKQFSKISYSDEWANIEFVFDSTGAVTGTITEDIPLEVVVYWDRKWFLGKKTYFVEAHSPNPNANINTLDNIQVRRK